MISAKDHFAQPTTRVNERWQTDFTYFKATCWRWYYLCMVLEDYSRYILAWRWAAHMVASALQVTLQLALDKVKIN